MRTLTVKIFALTLLLPAIASAQRSGQPNIIVFLCDDLGYGDLSSYGHPVINTPNIDKMAASGIRLTDYYSPSPVCSPSRVGLLTGRSPNRAGVYDFIPGPRKSEDCRDLVHLRKEEITIPALLKSAGYATCLVGKWHCNSMFNSDRQPQPGDFGFEYWFATHNNAAPSHENPNNFVRNGSTVGELKGYSSQIIVDEAISWLKQKDNASPFYLQVCFHEPHEPVASPPGLAGRYLPFSSNQNQAEYFANVANVDSAVGRLLRYLDEVGDDNTFIIFTSDNGPETLKRTAKAVNSYGSSGNLKGRKLWTNEAGFRVPCILSRTGGGTFTGTSDAVVSGLDFLPTFCELAGVALPEHYLDGESFSSLLYEGKFVRSKPLLWSFYNALNAQVVAMRDGDWKIMSRLKTGPSYLPKLENIYEGNVSLVKGAELTDFTLYNLKMDKSESEDLSGKYPDVFERMTDKLKREYGKLLADSYIWKRD